MSLALLVFPLIFLSSQINRDTVRLNGELSSVQNRLNKARTPAPAAQTLSNQINQLDKLAGAIQTATVPSGVNWPAVVTAIGQYDHAQVTLTALTQAGNRLTLSGQATDDVAVSAYTQALANAQVFAKVDIQSRKLVPLLPTPASTESTSPREAELPKPVEFVLVFTLNQPQS